VEAEEVEDMVCDRVELELSMIMMKTTIIKKVKRRRATGFLGRR
jgi:hypothetical protein